MTTRDDDTKERDKQAEKKQGRPEPGIVFDDDLEAGIVIEEVHDEDDQTHGKDDEQGALYDEYNVPDIDAAQPVEAEATELEEEEADSFWQIGEDDQATSAVSAASDTDNGEIPFVVQEGEEGSQGVEADVKAESGSRDTDHRKPEPDQKPSSGPQEHRGGDDTSRALTTRSRAIKKTDADGVVTVAGSSRSTRPDRGDGSGRLGDRLINAGIITADQLNVAMQEKKNTGKMIGATLVDLGFIDEETLMQFLADSSGYDVFDPRNTIVDSEALSLISKDDAVKYQVLPVSLDGDEAVVATPDPQNVMVLDKLRRLLPKDYVLKPVMTTPTVLMDSIDAAYGFSNQIDDILQELEEHDLDVDISELSEEEAYSHPLVRLCNAFLIDAVKMGVSDLHFEPEENFVRLRYRLDGVLYTAHILHKKHWGGLGQRLKIMAGMNIADKLTAQDGRFNLNVGGREADFRVSTLPTVTGENIVLRVLDKKASIMPLAKLGFSPSNMDIIKRSQQRPEGIIIVTGPTGSGKSTSLYSMLNEINDVEVNIQTLEDPVEYSLPMLRQTHVREGVLDFADGIKALLRQDPDIIFIGEIRDHVTAEMALKAAMTGHQVYTTLHTNDSFGAVPRLLDLGLKPGMIAGNIISVFAQRLVRRLCPDCKEPHRPSEEECTILGWDYADPPEIFRAHQGGCPRCAGQGYSGRVAIAEILYFDDELDEVVAEGKSKAELRKTAVERGFKDMRDDGILKILEGVTSISALSKAVDIARGMT